MYDAGVALNGLACFVSPDLARDLANDIMTLVSVYLDNVHMHWASGIGNGCAFAEYVA